MTAKKYFSVAPFPHTVYVFWGAGGECLYVGCAIDPYERRVSHMRKGWWSEVRTGTFETLPDLATGLAREKSLIERLHPKYNQTHNRAAEIAERKRLDREKVEEYKSRKFRCPDCGGLKRTDRSYCHPCELERGWQWRSKNKPPKPPRSQICTRCGERPKVKSWWCRPCQNLYNYHLKAGRNIIKDPI